MNKYYVVIPIGEETPDQDGMYLAYDQWEIPFSKRFNKDTGWVTMPYERITHWLKPIDGVIYFELKDMIECIYEGKRIGEINQTVYDDIQQIKDYFKTKYDILIIPKENEQSPKY